jgi:hypothetical protein
MIEYVCYNYNINTKKGAYMKVIRFCLFFVLSVFGLANCSSTPDLPIAEQAKPNETQAEKFWRLYEADSARLIVGNDNWTTIENIEAVFKPVFVTGALEANSLLAESEPGIPHYFKLQALYKGYVSEPNLSIFLQTETEKNVFNTVHNWIIGCFLGIEWTFPTEANCTATFYLVGGRFTEPYNETGI